MRVRAATAVPGTNLLEAARLNEARRYFYASTACVYNEDLQLDPSNPGLKEADAWPAKPQVCLCSDHRMCDRRGGWKSPSFGKKEKCRETRLLSMYPERLLRKSESMWERGKGIYVHAAGDGQRGFVSQ